MVYTPQRAGYVRPFGTARFIIDFLKGEGSRYGQPKLDPTDGAPQRDIWFHYKQAMLVAIAEDQVAWEEDQRIRRGGTAFTEEEWEERRLFYLERIPFKLTRMRYSSFLHYFNKLKLLGWVELTGEIEDSEAQDRMGLKPDEEPGRQVGQPRIFYRITAAGKRATSAMLSNPLRLLYPQYDSAYSRSKKKEKRYYRRRGRPRA